MILIPHCEMIKKHIHFLLLYPSLASGSYQALEPAQAISYSISCLLLHNKLPQIQWLKATHIYYHPVSVAKNLDMIWQGPLLRLQSRYGPAGILLDAWLEKNLLSSLFRLLRELICLWLYDWGLWLPTDCWLVYNHSYLPHGPFHRQFITWLFVPSKEEVFYQENVSVSISLCPSLSLLLDSYITKHHHGSNILSSLSLIY